MKSIRQKNEIGWWCQRGYVVGVTFHKVAIRHATFG